MRNKPNFRIASKLLFNAVLILLILTGCSTISSVDDSVAIEYEASSTTIVKTAPPILQEYVEGLSDNEIATLNSLEQVDEYPLYTMLYYGEYDQQSVSMIDVQAMWEHLQLNLRTMQQQAWGCSLFAALGEDEDMQFGRNFDWEYSPALLLFTQPQDGYASVTMVDIAYLGFGGAKAHGLTELHLKERGALLNAPYLPFDGMNEHGLAVGMAAVPSGGMKSTPSKETIGSLMVIRKMLDYARNVDEAIAILGNYNIDFEGGPAIHYLIADPSGRAALVEFYQGEMIVIPNKENWHQATNFLRAGAGESPEGKCWRYDRISERLSASRGKLTAQEAMELLEDVSQDETQWSIVYGISESGVNVVMGRTYGEVSTYQLGDPDG
ncbi:carcinine hydrolase/isopenicillin-N N-acyltransferase family protein [Chloroflexota bacterium]